MDHKFSPRKSLSTLQSYGLAVASVALATVVALGLWHYDVRNVAYPLFLFAIALTAWNGGGWAAVVAVVLPPEVLAAVAAPAAVVVVTAPPPPGGVGVGAGTNEIGTVAVFPASSPKARVHEYPAASCAAVGGQG